MNFLFTPNAWADYLFLESNDKKTLKRVNIILEDIARHGNVGLGKPEPLLGDLASFWSRRIDEKNRLVYRINQGNVEILACLTHYGKK